MQHSDYLRSSVLRRSTRRVDLSNVNTNHLSPLPHPPHRGPPQNLVFRPANSSNRHHIMQQRRHHTWHPPLCQILGYRYPIPTSPPRKPRIPLRSPHYLCALLHDPLLPTPYLSLLLSRRCEICGRRPPLHPLHHSS